MSEDNVASLKNRLAVERRISEMRKNDHEVLLKKHALVLRANERQTSQLLDVYSFFKKEGKTHKEIEAIFGAKLPSVSES